MAEAASHQVVTLPSPADGLEGGDIVAVVGDNLRRLRTRKGLSLERLAKASGVSRAMLGQIELGRSAPTINVLWKIARSLDAPLSAFTSATGDDDVVVLRAHRTKVLSSRNGRFSSRALFPTETPRRVEFYELRIAPQTVEEAEGHLAGTMENLVVVRGSLEVAVDGEHYLLDAGDAIQFIADKERIGAMAAGLPVHKSSSGKRSRGGRKEALRLSSPDGTVTGEVVHPAGRPPAAAEPFRVLTTPLVRGGEVVAAPNLAAARELVASGLRTLPPEGLDLARGGPAIPTNLIPARP